MTFPFLRVAQMRFTESIGTHGTWSIALEDPAQRIDVPPTLAGAEKHPMPEVTGRLRWMGDGWHTQLSGFAGMVRFRPDTGGVHQEAIWGLGFGGKVELGAKDAISGKVTVGNGVARFRGGTVTAIDESGALDPIEALGVMVSYDHDCLDRFTPNASYGWTSEDESDEEVAVFRRTYCESPAAARSRHTGPGGGGAGSFR